MKWWTISIGGYGEFQYFGTREQTDERAKQKARWEGGSWRVREATEIEATAGAEHIRWRKENAYPLERWEREAISLN